MGKMVQVLVGFDEGLLERIDAVKGLVPRAAWIRAAVERALGEVPEGAVVRPVARAVEPERPMDLQERIVRTAGRQRFTEKALAKRLGVDEREVEKVVRLMVQSGLLVRFGDLVGIPEKLRGAV